MFGRQRSKKQRQVTNPLATLYSKVGTGLDVSSGPMVLVERQEGAFSRNAANDSFYDSGLRISSGGLDYTVGPYAAEATFSVYGGQDAAVLALKAGDVDYLLNPLGMQRGLLSQVESDENLKAVVNPTYGFRYLAFNLRKEPMSIQGFRDALALMIDKEFMANNVLQGVAFPLYATMPEGNLKWYNAEVAESFASQYRGKTLRRASHRCGQILKDCWLHAGKPSRRSHWTRMAMSSTLSGTVLGSCTTVPRCRSWKSSRPGRDMTLCGRPTRFGSRPG